MLGPHRLSKKMQDAHHQVVGSLSSFPVLGDFRKVMGESSCGDICEDLRKLCKKGHWEKALHLMDLKNQQDAGLNLSEAYSFLLKECMEAKALSVGKQIHDHIRKNGLNHSITLNNIILHMYVKCASIVDAREVFNSMLHKDINSWTLMIGGYTKSGHAEEAFKLFCGMEFKGVKPNGVTCVNILKACTTLTRLMKVHAYVIVLGVHPNLYVGNTLLDMYSKCGSVDDAVYIFTQLPVLSVISWNTIIAGHTQHGFSEKAFELFQDMKLKGIKPDEVTFLSIIKACTSNLGSLKQIHVEICYSGLESDSFVASALIDMYAVFGNMKYARMVFERVILRDAPLWNSIILGHAEHGDATEALKLFDEMEQDKMVPDKVTFLSLLKACVCLRYLAMGERIFARITQRGLETWAFVGSALVDMYAKCGNLEDARHVFDSMPQQDLVSWNAIIAGYSTHEPAKEAFSLFKKMEREGVKPDKVTFLTILKACASSGAFELGKYIHACIFDNGFDSDVFVGSTLIDMYGKCGSVYHAREVFNTMRKRDEVSWSAMIAGYAQHGHAEEALELFLQMEREGVAMDDVTFVGVLTACTHAGLVDKGCEYFDSMKTEHGIMPTAEVCACMVDLLGRAGQVKEAAEFIKEAEIEPTASVWMALLNACKILGDVNLAELASEKIRELDPHSTAAFVLLSNAYATSENVG